MRVNTNLAFKKLFKITLVFLLLGGCATGGHHAVKPVTENLSNYKTLFINVSSQVPNTTQETFRLESVLVSKLSATGSFERISG